MPKFSAYHFFLLFSDREEDEKHNNKIKPPFRQLVTVYQYVHCALLYVLYIISFIYRIELPFVYTLLNNPKRDVMCLYVALYEAAAKCLSLYRNVFDTHRHRFLLCSMFVLVAKQNYIQPSMWWWRLFVYTYLGLSIYQNHDCAHNKR